MTKNFDRQNRYCFGLGTVGRDMFYTMVSMFLMQTFITEVLDVSDYTLAILTPVLMILRVFDAVNDPLMGVLVDNTRSRFGKFKPGMLIGAVGAAVFMVPMFIDMGLTGAAYAVVLGLLYLCWDVFYGLNDIAYWSMMPSLSTSQTQREKLTSFARICANIGLFVTVVGVIPITNMLGEAVGDLKTGWLIFVIIIVALLLGYQAVTLIGVKEHKGYFKEEEKTSVKEMFQVLFKNDQLELRHRVRRNV